MADEINVGRLVAEIILESKTDGADEAISKIKEVNTAAGDGKIELAVDVKNTDDLNYIRDVLDTIGINGTEAEKILSSAFANTSGLSQYKEKLEQISVKIDEQREKIKTLQEWTSSSTSHKILSNLDVESSHNEEIEKEIETLKKLEDEFDRAYASQDEWVIKQVKNFQKQEAATDSAAAKQEKLNQKMSDKTAKDNVTALAKTVTSSLKTIDTSTSGVFDGAAWVMFGKPKTRGQMEIYNDIDSNLVNLYLQIKNNCAALQAKIDRIQSRELFVKYRNDIRTGADLTDVQRAAEYWYLIKCSFCADKWSFATDAKNINAADKLNLYSDRLNGVIIENRDFEHLIKTYDRPGACFYCDPPYVGSEQYYKNNSNALKMADHERLNAVLKTLKGRFILSYNDCDYIRDAYRNYNIRAVTRRNLLPAKTENNANNDFKEIIITNF